MKKNIFAAILFLTAHCASSQVNAKLTAVAKEISYNKQKQPAFVTLKENNQVDEANTTEFINSVIFSNGLNKAVNIKSEKDDYGYSHNKFAVTQNGIMVFNKIITAHCKNGKLISLNGDLYAPAQPANKFTLTEQAALTYALKKVHAKKYKWENKAEEAHMREVLNQHNFSYYPTATKVIFEKAGKYSSAYQFTIYAEEPLYKANVFVDAATGKVIGENNLICNIDVPGTAQTKYSGTQNITCGPERGFVPLKRNTKRTWG